MSKHPKAEKFIEEVGGESCVDGGFYVPADALERLVSERDALLDALKASDLYRVIKESIEKTSWNSVANDSGIG